MNDQTTPAGPHGLALMFGWGRLCLALSMSALVGLVLSPTFVASVSVWQVMAREMFVGLAALIAFGIPEQWPRKLPPGVARWALQLGAVACVIPPTALTIYFVISQGDPIPFWKNENRMLGLSTMIATGLLVAPWCAIAALFRQRELALQSQFEAFALERSELERKALDSRLRLLQAQVEPHFLFNTLANVRELVDSGSPQASAVLGSLIAYLRAAVPRLHDPITTMDQELQLVGSYLKLMHMRMPDRLKFSVEAEEATKRLRCPPTTLLTLVENAVRHGIDPSEEGGRIDVRVSMFGGRCRAEVTDTGVGLIAGTESLGTGLNTLRERLELVFGKDAQLRLVSMIPHGVRAEVDFPAQGGA